MGEVDSGYESGKTKSQDSPSVVSLKDGEWESNGCGGIQEVEGKELREWLGVGFIGKGEVDKRMCKVKKSKVEIGALGFSMWFIFGWFYECKLRNRLGSSWHTTKWRHTLDSHILIRLGHFIKHFVYHSSRILFFRTKSGDVGEWDSWVAAIAHTLTSFGFAPNVATKGTKLEEHHPHEFNIQQTSNSQIKAIILNIHIDLPWGHQSPI